MSVVPASAQYYLRGSIRDEKNSALPNAKIFVFSTRLTYTSGSDGSFGINTNLAYDSLKISLEGYGTKNIKVKTDQWQTINLKISAVDIAKSKPSLISIIKDKKQEQRLNFFTGNETYFQLIENERVATAEYPGTGFSLNVNKASYSNVRRFINMGSKVPPDAVRTEELINYFNLSSEQPTNGETFKIKTSFTPCPWNDSSRLLFLNINARKIDLDKTVPGNFVFLIDISGSMDMPNRLSLLKAAFQLFIKNLRPVDKVSIVVYGGAVAVWLPPTAGSEKETISKSIEMLEAGGDTPGEMAIQTAYRVARESFIQGGNNRVILATDGDFNVGIASENDLGELITKQRQSGVYLTCLGVGMGNLKDSKLLTLAKRGNGNYAYLDDIHEAEKVLVHELTETLYTVADNASLNIIFYPAAIKQYRLIGFDNKKEAIADASSELEGGEIGSGSAITAIFEILPEHALEKAGENIAALTVRYHESSDKTGVYKNIIHFVKTMPQSSDSFSRCKKFSIALAMYAQKLKDSRYLNNASWQMISQLATEGAEPGNFLQQNFIAVLNRTIEIYDAKKKKKVKK